MSLHARVAGESYQTVNAREYPREFVSPDQLAEHLSKYITCPSSIVAGTANHFGKHRAVSLDKAKRLVEMRKQAKIRKDVHADAFESAETESIARMEKKLRQGSADLAKVIRLQAGMDWPCGHVRSPETTHTIAGKGQCRVCRRARWNAGFRRAVIRLAAVRERRRVLSESMMKMHFINAAERERKLKEITEASNGRIPLTELLYCVASSFGLTVPQLRSPARDRDAVHARAVVVKIMHGRGMSLSQVGQFLGGRDHSTAIHAWNSWEKYVKRDPRVLNAYRAYGDAIDEG